MEGFTFSRQPIFTLIFRVLKRFWKPMKTLVVSGMAIYLFLWIPEVQTDFLTYLPLVTMTMLSISTLFIIQVVCELWREGEVETWHVRLCQRLESPKESRKEGFTKVLHAMFGKLWKSFRNKWCLYTMTCYPFSNWQSAREIRPLCLFSQSFISRGSKPSYPFRARRAVAHSFVLDKENLLSQTCISGFFFRLKMMAIFKVFVLVMVSYMIGVQNETKIHHRVKKMSPRKQ